VKKGKRFYMRSDKYVKNVVQTVKGLLKEDGRELNIRNVTANAERLWFHASVNRRWLWMAKDDRPINSLQLC